jgi:uncharacterized protein DUF3592
MSAPSIFRQALLSGQLFAGIVLLVISGAFCTITGSFLLEEWAYRSGMQSDATVTRKHMRAATSSSSTAYEVTYKIRSPGGPEWQKTSVIDPSVWERVEEGGPIRVQYLAGDPDSLRIARQGRLEFALGGVAAVMAGLALVALWMVGRGGRDVWRLRRLYKQGQPSQATVTSVHETNVSINRRIQWAIDFTFQDHLGQMQHGTSAPMPDWQALEWKKGDKGIARFDPQRPTDNVWVGDEEVRT